MLRFNILSKKWNRQTSTPILRLYICSCSCNQSGQNAFFNFRFYHAKFSHSFLPNRTIKLTMKSKCSFKLVSFGSRMQRICWIKMTIILMTLFFSLLRIQIAQNPSQYEQNKTNAESKETLSFIWWFCSLYMPIRS